MSSNEDVDLFGEETAEEQAAREKKEAEKAAAKAQPKGTKSSILLDVKPWDSETDLNAMEEAIRALHFDGLLWGATKQVEIAYGVKKLQIMITLEDEKVEWQTIEDSLLGLEDFIQSIDIVAWNKI